MLGRSLMMLAMGAVLMMWSCTPEKAGAQMPGAGPWPPIVGWGQQQREVGPVAPGPWQPRRCRCMRTDRRGCVKWSCRR